MKKSLVTIALAIAAVLALTAQDRAPDQARRAGAADRLQPTAHPPLPRQLSHYWFVPDPSAASTPAGRGLDDAVARFARGARLIAAGDFAAGLPLVTPQDLVGSPLEPYAQFYRAVALEGLSRLDEADASLTALVARKPEGYSERSRDAAAWVMSLSRATMPNAPRICSSASAKTRSAARSRCFSRSAAPRKPSDTRTTRSTAYGRVYYDFPLSTRSRRRAGRHRAARDRVAGAARPVRARAGPRASSCLTRGAGRRRARHSSRLRAPRRATIAS